MIVPLYGFVEGDTMGLLVLSHKDSTGSEIIAKLADAASARVDPRGPWRLMVRGRDFPPDKTIEDVGIGAFERIDLRRKDGAA